MATNSPIVSIILPVYNGAATLKATLQSLLNQTFGDFEVLIGIDGTTDASKAIAEAFNDSRIKIIEHPENLGLANNVNALIALAHSDIQYYAMAEQDDVYVPQRLEWQLEIMAQQPEVGMVSGIAEFMGDGGNILFPGILVHGRQFQQGEDLFAYLYEQQLKVVNTCMLWRKEVHHVQGLRFNNTYGNFNVDWDFILRFTLISEIYGIPKVLVHMNRKKTVGSTTTDNKAEQHDASRQLLKDFKNEFPDLIDATLYRKALKQHRKIELGHRGRLGILLHGCYYALRYRDVYFLRYLGKKINHFVSGN